MKSTVELGRCHRLGHQPLVDFPEPPQGRRQILHRRGNLRVEAPRLRANPAFPLFPLAESSTVIREPPLQVFHHHMLFRDDGGPLRVSQASLEIGQELFLDAGHPRQLRTAIGCRQRLQPQQGVLHVGDRLDRPHVLVEDPRMQFGQPMDIKCRDSANDDPNGNDQQRRSQHFSPHEVTSEPADCHSDPLKSRLQSVFRDNRNATAVPP